MKPDIQFLINCCKTSPTAPDIEQIRTHITQLGNQQLSEMTTLAHTHGIFPLVYHAIQTHATDLLPDASLARLKQQNMAIVMQNMHMTAELIRIMRLLEDNEIQALAFKGPALAQLAYGDITLRQYGDLDILIDDKHLYQVAQLIVEQGYKPMGSIEFLKNEAKLHIEKNYEFYGKKNNIKLEVHWRLTNAFLEDFKNYTVWQNTQEVKLNKASIPTLNTRILLLYLCNHGASHMWERIEWIADIDRLLNSSKNSLDWGEIINSNMTLQSKTALLLGLGLTNKLFDTKLPTEILALLNHDLVVAKLIVTVLNSFNSSDLLFQNHTSKNKNFQVFLFQLTRQNSLSKKLRYLLQTMFGYSDRDVMLINLPRFFSFLYYPLRIGRIIKKYTVAPIKNLFTKSS